MDEPNLRNLSIQHVRERDLSVAIDNNLDEETISFTESDVYSDISEDKS
jgi:hypothetical protein